MKPTLYLHIGHSKVASTSIQDFLEANLDALRDRGYLVADLDFRFPTTGSKAANPVGELERLKAMGTAGAQEVAKRMRTLHAELTAKGSRFDKAVISAENLCNPGFAELFASTLDLFDVRLVYYIRRQDEWLISAWKQWGIKEGKSLDDFCLEGTATRYPAFTVCLKRWEKLAASVHLKPLHKSALFEGSVTKDFARAIALPPDGLRHPGIRNASFDASVLEVLRYSPHLFQHRDDDRIFHFLESFLSKEVEPMRSLLTQETRQRLFDYFESENRSLHGQFFPEADFEAVFGLGKDESQERPSTSPELVMRFLGLQLRGIMDLQGRVDALEKQLDRKNQPSLR
jgi:hypothetical protein